MVTTLFSDVLGGEAGGGSTGTSGHGGPGDGGSRGGKGDGGNSGGKGDGGGVGLMGSCISGGSGDGTGGDGNGDGELTGDVLVAEAVTDVLGGLSTEVAAATAAVMIATPDVVWAAGFASRPALPA